MGERPADGCEECNDDKENQEAGDENPRRGIMKVSEERWDPAQECRDGDLRPNPSVSKGYGHK